MPKLNEKLITKVLKHIKADLRRLKQNWWAKRKTRETAEDYDDWPACKAAGCFAGWAVLLSTPKKKWASLFNRSGLPVIGFYREAAELLGLTDEEADYLFEAASGYAKKDYKTLEERLAWIRALREGVSNPSD